VESGKNHEYMQAYNQRLVLDLIRLQGPISRADIARSSGLTAPTVSRIVNDLLEHGFALETAQRRGSLGKPPVDLVINPDGAYAIGFNFDRDQLVGVLINLGGEVLLRVQHDPEVGDPETVLPLMDQAAKTFAARAAADGRPLLGVGVGIPGPLHINPVPSAELFELPGWAGIDVQGELSRRFGLPTYLENNPFAAAIGELWHGEGRSLDTFYFIFFGLYLGGCLVVNRQPIRGSGGFAAEFGSIPFGVDPHSPDGVARLGHSVSLAALYDELERHGRSARDTDTLESLYRSGDPRLLAWLGRTADSLAPELCRLECTLDPAAIVFGERLPAPLVAHLIRELDARLGDLRVKYKPYGPRLLRGWAGVDAAPLGAATLPIYNALSPSPPLIQSRIGNAHAAALGGALF
jgi:predicted NBD/HSP70 family sugar kinase